PRQFKASGHAGSFKDHRSRTVKDRSTVRAPTAGSSPECGRAGSGRLLARLSPTQHGPTREIENLLALLMPPNGHLQAVGRDCNRTATESSNPKSDAARHAGAR